MGNDSVYGTKLTREELQKYVPENQPIPFVYIYACTIKKELDQGELYQKINSMKKKIPDLKGVINLDGGTPYDCIILEFTKKQWAISFRFKGDEIWVDMSFRGTGKKWGSNYALWQVHQKWLLEDIGAIKICDSMEHVNPIDIKTPK